MGGTPDQLPLIGAVRPATSLGPDWRDLACAGHQRIVAIVTVADLRIGLTSACAAGATQVRVLGRTLMVFIFVSVSLAR